MDGLVLALLTVSVLVGRFGFSTMAILNLSFGALALAKLFTPWSQLND
jgi:hypothetical protein